MTRMIPGRNTSVRAIAQARRDHGVRLRLMGLTYQQIADSILPCDKHRDSGGSADCPACLPMYGDRGTARKAIEQQLAQDYAAGASERDTLRQQIVGQIDLVVRRLMSDALSKDPQVRGAAARTLVRVWDRKARLLGLDAPTRVQVTSEVDEELQQIAAAIAGSLDADADADAVAALAADLDRL